LLEDPTKRKKELEAGKITLRTERDAPLMHVVIGNAETETKKLVENLQALAEALSTKLNKITLAATMSPGVKVEFKTKKDETA
jgi:ribosomal protein L1